MSRHWISTGYLAGHRWNRDGTIAARWFIDEIKRREEEIAMGILLESNYDGKTDLQRIDYSVQLQLD